MRKRVVVIGGGVAGLTAAHELIERGFDVKLYERNTRLGGKAASLNNTNGFPAEHGFRFFPGWYQHLPDTLRRIPYEERYEKRTVHDNLIAVEKTLFAGYHYDSFEALVRLPRSWDDIKTATSFARQLPELGLSGDDLSFFFARLLKFAATPESIRARDYDEITWWDFLDADTRGPSFQKYLATGLTRNTVAAKPKEASAYCIGHCALRTLFDSLRPQGMDRVLNGPTNEVWIDPWRAYLTAQGVDFVTEAELDSIEFDREKIKAVTFTLHDSRRHRALARAEALRLLSRLHVSAAAWLPAFIFRKTSGVSEIDAAIGRLVVDWEDEFLAGRGGDLELELQSELKTFIQTSPGQQPNAAQTEALDAWRTTQYETACAEHQRALESVVVEAEYFVFALPIEQIAYYVHRSEMMRRNDPSLTNTIILSQQVDWMAGIQFYLTEKVSITPGHIDCVDSEWHLTAISQTQFWPDVDMKERGEDLHRGRVKAILSVDISAWDVRGRLHRKEAFACTRREIAEEVWDQLKRSLNRPSRRAILHDDMLLRDPSDRADVPEAGYWLDDNIIGRFDRRKQALYKKLESVQVSSEAVLARQGSDGGSAVGSGFAYGDGLEVNVEPLLINRPGSLKLRPGPSTAISNMFLASDYVRTNTILTSMEGANEAARLAVNAILRESGSREEPCRIWQWQPSDVVRSLEGLLLGRGGTEELSAVTPFRLAAQAATAATGFASRILERFIDRKK